ncbi:ABC transporter ATP-binding protein [Dactylosporangium matsuzakiense]|uniref:ABC transporter ATP-binding protein n=1 Tax=Dactylosporangium matsuzakiense TaxID=53360 RepID=A0A9W6KH12_9ACTN|nr:ABC transporter ATP-binding protein [Dactylosporangium matsuzakiense]UWZ42258.1 ABC transporter ATP-binding protein [Dactylosporangium matsuzakiense]GLK99914.1 ABC transporter ATP-binding protein [Dactylosporangium matsuzakiense]
MTHVIDIQGLVKSFGPVRALDGLDLAVRAGEVHGFLGPNGAGKSTTIRVLLGLMRPSGGRVTLFGADPWHDAARLHERLAYVAGDVALWPALTGGQCLDVIAATHGRVDARRRQRLVDRFALDLTKRVREYSKGNRQKVALVAALAADVELLVLDEPTSGLDPLMEHAFQQSIRERRDDGATVLLSSHLLSEVEALADRVSIVRRGRTVTTGGLSDLRRHARTSVHAVTVRPPEGLDRAEGVADFAETPADGARRLQFTIDAGHLDAAIGRLHAARLLSLTVTPPSLDALFLSAYAGASVGDVGTTRPEAVS